LLASLSASVLPDKARQLLGIALRNSERLSRLVDDLLDQQRIALGRMDYHMVPTPVSHVIADAVETIRPMADARKVAVAIGADCPDAVAVLDPARMNQVLDNLLSNAIKFSQPGQTVTVSLERRPRWLRITVADHGAGIPAAFRSRIFQPFSQADGTDGRKVGGSGLGLSIVKGIVASHGGRVTFDSQEGIGTRFHVDLREMESQPPAAAA